MTRGVLYITYPGETPTAAALDRSISSLTEYHPELPHHVVKLDSGSLLDKARMFDLSPYDETLSLDVDTVVMGRLDYGFEKAAKHGLACCICECPWARRYPCFSGDEIEYNTGVAFFTRKARLVFDAWRDCATEVNSSIVFNGDKGKLSVMPSNDQAGFAMAIERTGFNPWVLPLNWNFRHRWQKTVYGQIRIWHDYDPVPGILQKWNEQQSGDQILWECQGMEGSNSIIECAQVA